MKYETVGPSIFIALLNPSISLVLAAGFALLWYHRRAASYLAVLSAGYIAWLLWGGDAGKKWAARQRKTLNA